MPDGRHHNVNESHREHKLPGEGHELVGAEAGQGAAQPNEEGHKREELEHEPEPARNEIEKSKRGEPSAQEQGYGHTAHGKEAEIFAEEKEREFEPGIFREITGHQFGFGFGEVKVSAVGLGGGCDEKKDEAGEASRCEDMPRMQETKDGPGLVGDNRDGGQGAGH